MHLRVRTRERLPIPVLAGVIGVTLLVACTSTATHQPATHQPAGQQTATRLPATATAVASAPPVARSMRIAGRRMPVSAACPSATPVYLETQGPVVVTTVDGLTVSGLMQARSVPPRRGDVKIVWRVTGRGSLRLGSTAPNGRPGRLVFGPEPHGGSSFDAPGDEWGSGFSFSEPGCWRVEIVRGGRTAPVTIAIA